MHGLMGGNEVLRWKGVQGGRSFRLPSDRLAVETAFTMVVPHVLGDREPGHLQPAIGGHRAQCDHRIDMSLGSVHLSPFQPAHHDQLGGTLTLLLPTV